MLIQVLGILEQHGLAYGWNRAMLITHLTNFIYFIHLVGIGLGSALASSYLYMDLGAFGPQQLPSCLEIFSGNESLCFKYMYHWDNKTWK